MKNLLYILLLLLALPLVGQNMVFMPHTPVVSAGREAYWSKFNNDYTDEGGESSWSTTGSPSFVTSSPTPQEGSHCLFLNLSLSDYLTLPGTVTPGDSHSLSFWVYQDDDQISAEIFANGSTAGDFMCRLNSTNQDFDVYTDAVESTAENFYGSSPVSGVWLHFIYTYNGTTGEVVIYYNGTDATDTDAGTSGVDMSGTWTLGLGTDGYFDDVRLYNFVLTSTNATWLANVSNAGDPLPAD